MRGGALAGYHPSVNFLWLISRPLLEKLDRIKLKYGLIEAWTQAWFEAIDNKKMLA